MAKTSTIQVKFEGYDKTFSNINAIAEELTNLTDDVIKVEEQLAKADFGSDQWNELSQNLIENTKLVEDFGKAVEETGVVSVDQLNKATAGLVKTNKKLEDSNAKLERSQEDLAAASKERSDALIDAGVKITQAFVTTTGTILSFASSEEDAQLITAKLAQTMAIADSIEQSYNAVKAIGEVRTKALAVAEAQKTVVTAAGTVATEGAAVATTFLGRAIQFMLGPIGLVIGAVGALVSGYFLFRKSTKDVIDQQTKLNEKLLESAERNIALRRALAETNTFFEKDDIKRQEKYYEKAKELAEANFVVQDKALRRLEQTRKDIFARATEKELNDLDKLIDEQKIKRTQAQLEYNKLNEEERDFKIDTARDALNRVLDLQIQELSSKEGFNDKRKIIDLEYEKVKNDLDARRKKGDLTANADALIAYQEYNNNIINNDRDVANFELEQRQRVTEQRLADLALIDTTTARFQEIEIQRAIELDALNVQLSNQQIKSATEYETKLNDINNKAKNSTLVLLKQIKDETKAIADESKQISLDLLISDLNKISQDLAVDKSNQLKAIAATTASDLSKLDEEYAKSIEALGDINSVELEKQAEALTKNYEVKKAVIKKGEEEATKIVEENSAQRVYTEKLALQDIAESTSDILKSIVANEKLTIKERISANQELIKLQLDRLKILELEEIRLAKSPEAIDAIKNKYNNLRLSIISVGEATDKAIAASKFTKISNAIGDVNTIVQAGFQLTSQIIDLQTAALDAKLGAIDEKRQAIEDKLEQLNGAIAQTQTEISTLNSLIQDSEGSRRAFLIEGLEREQATRDNLAEKIRNEEDLKKGLAEEEKRINKQKEEQQKKADRLQRISTAIAAIATAVQAGLAVAKTAAETGTASPLFVPLTIAAIAAGIGAVTAIVGSVQKFEDGGELKGPSHDNGGIRGTGRFNNIEVEGGEFIINKESTKNNKSLLEAINNQGRFKKFANGGTLEPNILGMNKVVSTSNTVNAIESLAAKELQIGVVDIITAIDRVNKININTKIG